MILKQKKKGSYLIIEMDPDYIPDLIEKRTVFGLTLEQERNNVLINTNALDTIATKQKNIPDSAKRDLQKKLIIGG